MRWSCHSETRARTRLFPNDRNIKVALNVAGHRRTRSQTSRPPTSRLNCHKTRPRRTPSRLLTATGFRFPGDDRCEAYASASITFVRPRFEVSALYTRALIQEQLGQQLLPDGNRISFSWLLGIDAYERLDARMNSGLCVKSIPEACRTTPHAHKTEARSPGFALRKCKRGCMLDVSDEVYRVFVK